MYMSFSMTHEPVQTGCGLLVFSEEEVVRGGGVSALMYFRKITGAVTDGNWWSFCVICFWSYRVFVTGLNAFYRPNTFRPGLDMTWTTLKIDSTS